MGGYVFLLVMFGAMWLLVIRPQQQRLRAQRQLVMSLQVGDRIVTAGGVVGQITGLDDQNAQVEVAPGVIVTFLRAAVSRRLDDQAGAGQALEEGRGESSAFGDPADEEGA